MYYHIISYRIISYRIKLYHIILCYIILYYINELPQSPLRAAKRLSPALSIACAWYCVEKAIATEYKFTLVAD